MYTIKVNYNTGNSFGSHTEEDCPTELECEKIETANENLKRIKEHYEARIELEFGYKKAKLSDYADKPWFVESHGLGKGSLSSCVKLIADNGNEFNFSCSWVGYFERLNWCEVVIAPMLRYDF